MHYLDQTEPYQINLLAETCTKWCYPKHPATLVFERISSWNGLDLNRTKNCGIDLKAGSKAGKRPLRKLVCVWVEIWQNLVK